MSEEYYIRSLPSGRQEIRQHDSDLAIEIYQLELEPFRPTPGKMVMYGDDHGALLAFQTNAIDFPFEADLLGAALKWYAGYLDYPQMNVSLYDPRPGR